MPIIMKLPQLWRLITVLERSEMRWVLMGAPLV